MARQTPDRTRTGFPAADEWVLAVDISGGKAAPGDYETVRTGIRRIEAVLSSAVGKKQFVRSEQAAIKTGVRRVFSIRGDRCIGDTFQDWALSMPVCFGLGESVVVPYVYFCLRTGEGEQGEVTVLVRRDSGSGTDEEDGFFLSLYQAEGAPVPFTWNAG